MRHHLLAVASVLSILPVVPGQAKITIEPSKDNTLYDSATGTLSNGAGDRCFAGTSFLGVVRRALIAFNVAGQVPAGSKIVNVDLVLTAVNASSILQYTVTLHRVLADWGEAGSIAPMGQGSGGIALTGDATWIHTFYNTKRWTNAGGDFDATASGSANVQGLGIYTWKSTARMVAEVQNWLDTPATNFGWLLRSDESTIQTAKVFGTKEALAGTRPQLVITYIPPAAVIPVGTGCTGSGASPLTLSANGRPTVPNATFSLGLSGGPSGPGLFALALDLLSPPAPLGRGCLLYVNPIPILLVLPGNASNSLPLPIPNQSSLLGLSTAWQGAVGDAGGIVTSNGLTVRLGT